MKTKVFAPKPNNDLFKITNLRAFKSKRINKKHPLWPVLESIANDCGTNEGSVLKAYSYINFSDDNFNEPNDIVYANYSGDGQLYLTKSLKHFSEGYRTLKQWNINSWRLIA